MSLPPKPPSRSGRFRLLDYLRRFRSDILSAQPERLYGAWMADFRVPFFRSVMVNDPDLIDLVLRRAPGNFPKSDRVREGLAPLLGNSVFLTNGSEWVAQRRLIDPAFAGGRLKDTFGAMKEAAAAAATRMAAQSGPVEVEEAMSHAAADVIFRTLFSVPIEDAQAQAVFRAFRAYQRSQPLLNLAALLPLPRWFPRPHRREVRKNAARIRTLITEMVQERAQAIAHGTAPDDLATKIMTAKDPDGQGGFSAEEMVDQVAIFFLAGHETSASALGWALYLLATHPEAMARACQEIETLGEMESIGFSDISRLKFTRNLFRETLRLYPPVPMMVRQTARPETFRKRAIACGTQVIISPWHLHRHQKIWADPDHFIPERWETDAGKTCAQQAYLPFSAGPRVCPGAGFAMIEGPLLLAFILRACDFSPISERRPIPVAHLTVRAKDGIWLNVTPRRNQSVPR